MTTTALSQSATPEQITAPEIDRLVAAAGWIR
jgi:hypothetical protein